VVVLVGVRNPLNIGAAARAMANFGFERLRVVSSHEASFREAKSAVGASHVLANAVEHTNIADAIADCALVVGTDAGHGRAPDQPVHLLPAAAQLISQSGGNIALLFGSEKTGLSNEVLSHCDWLLRIPTSEAQPSMNLAQAVAVCLCELIREETPPREDEFQSAAAGDLERITRVLAEALLERGYMTANASAGTEENIRRMLHRLRINNEDGRTLLGIVRHLARKA
jgi:TrmH family RNA methyltransferase